MRFRFLSPRDRPDHLKEAPEAEFYATIMPLDLVIESKGIGVGLNETSMRFRDGTLKGVAVGQPGYPFRQKFYLHLTGSEEGDEE